MGPRFVQVGRAFGKRTIATAFMIEACFLAVSGTVMGIVIVLVPSSMPHVCADPAVRCVYVRFPRTARGR